MKKKHLILLSVFLLAFSLLQGEKSTLRIGINTFPPTLHPVYVTDETSQEIINKIYGSLFDFDYRGKIRPGLVESYSFLNQQEIKIKLRNNSFFSDGKALTVEDVRATVTLLQDKKFKYPYAANLKFIKKIIKIDQYTFILAKNYPYALWKNHLTFKILNSAELSGITYENFKQKKLLGTGFYLIQNIREPQKIVLGCNKYNKKAGMYDCLEYKIISYTELSPLKLINREIDICDMSHTSSDVYRKSKEWKDRFSLLKFSKFGYSCLIFNLGKEKLTLNLRKIFYNALIAGGFIKKFLQGKGEKIKTPFMLFNPRTEPRKLPVKIPSGKTIINIITNSESKLRKQFVLFLAQEMKKYNIDLRYKFYEYHTFRGFLKKRNFELALTGFLLEIDYDMSDIFNSKSPFNYADFKNPQMDDLLQKGLREVDQNRRVKIYLKAQSIWLENLPLLPLFNLYYFKGISKNIKIPKNTYRLVSSESDFLYNIDQWKE